MRNLVLVHCKRFLFRWETFAVTLLNILFAVFCTIAARLVYEPGTVGYNYIFYKIIFVIWTISGFCTMTAVIFIEINTLATGAVRNTLIAGYCKSKVYISKFVAVFLFSIIQGAICLIPSLLANSWMDNPFLFLITALLVYAELSCIAMAVCLLTDRAIVYVVILIGCLAGLMFGGNLLSSSLDKNQFLFEEMVADSEMVLQKNESPYYIHSPIRDFYEQILRISLLQPVNEYGDLYYNDKLSAAKISINYWKNEAENAVSEEQREQNLYMMEEIQTRMKRHTDRLSFFPYYQVGVLLIVCFGGTLLFRKRNLK